MRVRVTLAAMLVCLAASTAGVAAAAGPLRTAVYEPDFLTGSDGTTEFARIHAAGATFVRILAKWNVIATAKPASPADPTDPAYDWSSLDANVAAAAANGLEPIVDVWGTPSWMPGGGAAYAQPDLAQLGAFARAAARRYDGASGQPRVRYWEVWNEPNLNQYLTPQFKGATPVSPGIYRSMVNAFAAGVKSVASSNKVIAGELAPYGIQKKGQPINRVLSVAPLTFMRDLLCVSGGAHPHATCSTKARFDTFAVHPYTWGGPTHSAFSSDDVAIGDIPNVQSVLQAAWKLHRISAPTRPQLWVTEFSWDTNPPDPKAVAIGIQSRWTSEALYHLWADGVPVVTWFLLRDQTSLLQSGLYFRGETLAQDKPKPTLTAFRFPFVAYPSSKGTYVWGRTPDSAAHRVLVERKAGTGWQRVATLSANRFGIFQATLPLTSRVGSMRARLAGSSQSSLPFGLKAVPDRRISPFGS